MGHFYRLNLHPCSLTDLRQSHYRDTRQPVIPASVAISQIDDG
jgi:hypothetical protein